MNIDFDSFSPFWILFDSSKNVVKTSTYFSSFQKNKISFYDLLPEETKLIHMSGLDAYGFLRDKIITINHAENKLKFRGTIHRLGEELLLVCWPAFNKLEDINQNDLNNQMLHPACYLMDTLIIKDVLTKTQQKSHNIFLQKVEAEQLKKVSEEFLANMSHEIRTPLNGLLGSIQLFSDEVLSEEQIALLNIMNSSGQSLLKVLNDILDYSKINSGKVELDYIEFNLKELLESTIGLMSQVAFSKGLNLSLNNSNELDHNFIGDPLRIRQIITNFISNSLKFTEKGEIKVLAQLHGCEDESCNIKISVVDTGIGIPENKQSKLFSAFVQADSSTTRKYGGTGLGLSITSKLAVLMDGKVGFVSKEGLGSTFFLEVNLKKVKKSSLGNTEQNISVVTSFNADVLVVEDNKVNQKVVELMLKKLGVNCTIASSGKEAFSALENNTFTLILMDMQLPEISGVDVTKKIIDKYGADAPPIIALTANAFEDDRKRCLDAGMKDFLSKPLQRDQLLKVLSRYLK